MAIPCRCSTRLSWLLPPTWAPSTGGWGMAWSRPWWGPLGWNSCWIATAPPSWRHPWPGAAGATAASSGMPGTLPPSTAAAPCPGSGMGRPSGSRRVRSAAASGCGGAAAPARCGWRAACWPVSPGWSWCSASTGVSAMSCCAWRCPWPAPPCAGPPTRRRGCWSAPPSPAPPASRPAGRWRPWPGSPRWARLGEAGWRCCSTGPRGSMPQRSGWGCPCCGLPPGPIPAPTMASSACGWR